MKNKKIELKKRRIIASVLFIFLSINLINASFALSFPAKISLAPGQSIEREFTVQNVMEPNLDITVEVAIEEGSEYVSLVGTNTLEIPANEIKSVKLKIKVPENAKLGDMYKSTLYVKTLSSDTQEGGMIQFTSDMRKSFEIAVVSESLESSETPSSEKSSTSWIIGIIVLIAIILIAYFILKRK